MIKKKNISSFELAALEKELQFLVDGKISQIYHPNKKEIVFQVYARGKGKLLLRIIPGKFLNIVDKKETVLRPSGYCMQLRKYLNNSYIKLVYQKDSERILIIVLENAIKISDNEKKIVRYNLVIEFFSKGNLLITDEDWKIIGTLSSQRWESRTIKNREQYQFPPSGFDWKNLKIKQVEEIVKSSEKKNLATCLATELSLGGVVAEEVCKLKNIDYKKLPSEIKSKEIKEVCKSIKEILGLVDNEKTKAYLFDDGSSFPLKLFNRNVKQEFENYNLLLSLVNPFEKISPYQQKINAMNKIISQQEGSIKEIERSIIINTSKGDKIYSDYSKIQKLLEIVKELKKEKGWNEVKTVLEKEKKIVKVDLKNKKVLLNL